MRADRPLVGAVIFLGIGLGVIFGYCHGTTGFSVAYPLSGSVLHLDFTTSGQGVLGGVVCAAIGVFLLIWAFFAAFADLLARRELHGERGVERYSVVPAYTETPDIENPEIEQQRQLWSRPSSRSHI